MKVILKSGGPIMDVLTVEWKTVNPPICWWICQWHDSDGTVLSERFNPATLCKLVPVTEES